VNDYSKAIPPAASAAFTSGCTICFVSIRKNICTTTTGAANVESLFSAVKRLFGDSVRSKNDTAMKNEVLGKLLAYNITLLVHAIYELSLEPKFVDEHDEPPFILPMSRPG
jgi:hypothetical protein